MHAFERLAATLVLSVLGVLGPVGCASRSLESPTALERAEQDSSAWLRRHYTKSEHMIAMRDGVSLYTVVYAPRDTSTDYPILLTRTPYSCAPYGPDEYRRLSEPYLKHASDGYILVYQDVRGRNMSEGDFVDMRPHNPDKRTDSDIDEASDTWDTIDWLVRNVPRNNSRVGLWGISYPGFYAAAGMIDAHPALRAVSPQAPIADWRYDDFFHHGAFFLVHNFGFWVNFGRAREGPGYVEGTPFEYGTPDGYQFYFDAPTLRDLEARHMKGEIAFWTEVTNHPNDDEWWRARDITPHLRNVAPAVLTVGGWYDAEDLYGPLHIHPSVERMNPGAFNAIVMGPWFHGGWHRSAGDRLGDISFTQRTSPWYVDTIERPFFRHHLKGAPAPNIAEATMFNTGAHEWATFDAWPPERSIRSLYFHAAGRLSFDPPAGDGADAFVSDPAKPVPFTNQITRRMPREYMTEDQRFAARRPDVLVYQTEPLEEDVTIAGPILADLWVATTGQDADWVVKLIDVLPNDTEDTEFIRDGQHLGGYQMMVRSEVIRGRFRNDYARPEPFSPGVPARVDLPLQDVLHTFRKGHRIMVQVQSTWFPLVDRNPQTWVDNIFHAEPGDFRAQTHTVFRSGDKPSRLEVGVIASPPAPAAEPDNPQ